ncbi:hypothetical protein [Streptomyces sp. NPDC005125]
MSTHQVAVRSSRPPKTRTSALVVMADAHNVAPAIDGTRPTQAQALDRLALLAGRHASIITADWHALTQVLSTVVPRAAG